MCNSVRLPSRHKNATVTKKLISIFIYLMFCAILASFVHIQQNMKYYLSETKDFYTIGKKQSFYA